MWVPSQVYFRFHFRGVILQVTDLILLELVHTLLNEVNGPGVQDLGLVLDLYGCCFVQDLRSCATAAQLPGACPARLSLTC